MAIDSPRRHARSIPLASPPEPVRWLQEYIQIDTTNPPGNERAAAEYLAEGKSWGEGGPKQVVLEILESLDKETVLQEARREIRTRLGMSGSGA